MSDGHVRWNLLSNHGRVLLCISADPNVLLRDVAVRLGITERSVRRIVADLEAAGLITHHRVGNRNQYRVVGTGTPDGVDLDVDTIVSAATSGGQS